MFCELWLSQKYLRAGKKEKIISITALISVIGIAIGVMVLIVVISRSEERRVGKECRL